MPSEPIDAAPGYDEPSPILKGLDAVLREVDSPSWIELVGEDQTDKFATLIADLRQKPSTTGDGKRIASGFAYTGVEPALAWANACRDRLYPVMKQSIESFDRRWSSIRPNLGPEPYHYVSLGPGDGQKDAVILRDLLGDTQLCYIPVDTSTELLRLAVRDLMLLRKIPGTRILSLPWDFSARDSVVSLHRMLDGMFGETAVLFSLLGNTLANFDDDTDLLRMLAAELLRPQDRLLLEVATTTSLDAHLAAEASTEYKLSRSFGEFVTSALRRYTDLRVEKDKVLYQGSVESDRALLIKMIYRNQTGEEIRIKLPDHDHVKFPPDDTIRMLLTRKYTQAGLDSMLAYSEVAKVGDVHSDFAESRNRAYRAPFGMDLMILESAPAAEAVPAPSPPTGSSSPDIPRAIWHRKN